MFKLRWIFVSFQNIAGIITGNFLEYIFIHRYLLKDLQYMYTCTSTNQSKLQIIIDWGIYKIYWRKQSKLRNNTYYARHIIPQLSNKCDGLSKTISKTEPEEPSKSAAFVASLEAQRRYRKFVELVTHKFPVLTVTSCLLDTSRYYIQINLGIRISYPFLPSPHESNWTYQHIIVQIILHSK